MDSRLRRIAGFRLVPLTASDAPRVAQAILDLKAGKAKLAPGCKLNTSFVVIRSSAYAVVIRGDDWFKILSLIHYGQGTFKVVVPSEVPPAPVLSIQPYRVAEPVRPDPEGGLFAPLINWLSYADYVSVSKVLNKNNGLTYVGAPTVGSSLYPTGTGSTNYNMLVAALQELFPRDYPTTAL